MNNIEYALEKLREKTSGEIDDKSKFADAILDFWNLGQEHRFQVHARVFKNMDLVEYIERHSAALRRAVQS